LQEFNAELVIFPVILPWH